MNIYWLKTISGEETYRYFVRSQIELYMMDVENVLLRGWHFFFICSSTSHGILIFIYLLLFVHHVNNFVLLYVVRIFTLFLMFSRKKKNSKKGTIFCDGFLCCKVERLNPCFIFFLFGCIIWEIDCWKHFFFDLFLDILLDFWSLRILK